MHSILFAIALSLSCPAWAQQFIPDHARTPGAIDPGIKQDNIADTICVPGYTKTVRPPALTGLSSQLQRLLERPTILCILRESDQQVHDNARRR